MKTCHSCNAAVRFVDWNGDGISCRCADTNPHERAAIALFDDFKHSIGWPSKQWDDPALDDTDGRETFRHKARLALAAAIDEAELAEHIGLDHARTVAVHLLGSEAPDE